MVGFHRDNQQVVVWAWVSQHPPLRVSGWLHSQCQCLRPGLAVRGVTPVLVVAVPGH